MREFVSPLSTCLRKSFVLILKRSQKNEQICVNIVTSHTLFRQSATEDAFRSHLFCIFDGKKMGKNISFSPLLYQISRLFWIATKMTLNDGTPREKKSFRSLPKCDQVISSFLNPKKIAAEKMSWIEDFFTSKRKKKTFFVQLSTLRSF